MGGEQHRGVAVVFPAAGPTGGVERVAAEFLRHQSTRRPTTFVGVHDASGARPVGHVPVTPRPAPAALRPWAFRAAARRALPAAGDARTVSFGVECPPGDVLWVHSVHAAWLARGTPVPVGRVTVPASARRLLPRHRVLLALEQAYFRDATSRTLLCTSTQEVEDLVTHYGVPRERMHVVPNGYDPGTFAVGRRAALRPAARASLGAGDGDVVVLCVANEWHRKGLGVLLDAVAATGDRRLRVDLVGRRRPDAYLARARRLGLADRVRWHGGATDVAPYYAAADVVALPSSYEPFGIVVVEAMAMGVPVVVSALAGASAAVTDGRDGRVLADPRDVDALAAALAGLGEQTVRSGMGQAAASAVAAYTWDAVLSRADALAFD